MPRLLVVCLVLLWGGSVLARDASSVNPTFPRIGNCYGAGLSWRTWEQGRDYWSKLDLFVGGGYDLHYDWENPRWVKALATMADNIAKLREANPGALVLPYVDVIEGPDNPNVPKGWWDLNEKGERWSGWPGMYRINMKLPEVLQYNLDQVREKVYGREIFDGVFYDCWSPDDWLCPRTAALRDGQAIVMLNAWNLPRKGFEALNGVLAEDEINRVREGKVDFEDFLQRYLAWCRQSRKPVTTMIVCHPQSINDDPWRWSKQTREQRQAEQERARAEDEQTMRFGLATTLMGDGYFGYDCGTMGRGNWWWYKEYDAPLGYPRGDCRRNADGTWQREYDGGTVVVNGSCYDAVAHLARRCKDLSTGRVGTEFTLPMHDGRIFLPTDDPVTTTPDAKPRLTAASPATVQAVRLSDDLTVVQTPGGLELRFQRSGGLGAIMYKGRRLMTGGFPSAAAPPFTYFTPMEAREPGLSEAAGTVGLVFGGKLVRDDQQVAYTETVTVGPGNCFSLKFDFEALTALNLRLWRHYFAFPIADWAGGRATAEGRSCELPATLRETAWPPASTRFVLSKDLTVAITCDHALALVDHRKYGTDEYLLAGYPVSGAQPEGRKWSVETTVEVAQP